MDTEKNAYEVAFQNATNPLTRDDFWFFIFYLIPSGKSRLNRLTGMNFPKQFSIRLTLLSTNGNFSRKFI